MDRGGGESAGYDAVRRPRYVAAAAAARADVVPRVRLSALSKTPMSLGEGYD